MLSPRIPKSRAAHLVAELFAGSEVEQVSEDLYFRKWPSQCERQQLSDNFVYLFQEIHLVLERGKKTSCGRIVRSSGQILACVNW